MSKWANRRKRRIVATILLIFFFAVAGVVYTLFFSQDPNCFDGKHNGLESGTDCGGACDLVCPDDVRGMVVWWQRSFKVSRGVYNAVAYFENQNLQSGVQAVDYEFKLYNRDNELIGEPVVGTTFIEPNKRSAVFESGIETGDEEVYTTYFSVSPNQRWERTNRDFTYGLFQIKDPVLVNENVAPKLSADIENRSLYNFIDVPVVAILYDEEDNAVAVSQTYVDVINQSKTEKAYFSWPEPFGKDISFIEVIPRVNPFDQ